MNCCTIFLIPAVALQVNALDGQLCFAWSAASIAQDATMSLSSARKMLSQYDSLASRA